MVWLFFGCEGSVQRQIDVPAIRPNNWLRSDYLGRRRYVPRVPAVRNVPVLPFRAHVLGHFVRRSGRRAIFARIGEIG